MEQKRSRKTQYLVTLCLSVAFLGLGALSAWPSPVILKFKCNDTNVHITDSGVSWMVSMNPVGFIVGSFITRYTSDRLGRRLTVLASAPFQAIGSIIAVFALEGWLLCISQFLWSCTTGMLSTVIGIYLAEIADKDIRATLSLFTRFAFTLGNLLVMAIGPFITYNLLNYSLLPLPFVYLVACWWIPETPYYLLKEGNVYKAKKELRRLRGYTRKDEKSLTEEVESIRAGVQCEMKHSTTAKELFSGKQYRRAVIVAAGIKFTQIMTGGVAIKQYLGMIMMEGGLDKEQTHLGFVAFGLVSAVVSMVGSFLVDRMGRRPLLISSYLGTGLTLAFVGLHLFLLNVMHVDSLRNYSYLPTIAIILSSVISTFGFVALSGVIPAEIFPLNVKVVAMTSLNIFGGVLGFLVGKGYQNMKDLLNLHGVFWIFASIALFGAVFTFFVVPETGGKSLNDIQKELQGDAYEGDGEKLKDAVIFDVSVAKGTKEDDENEGTELEDLTKKTEQS